MKTKMLLLLILFIEGITHTSYMYASSQIPRTNQISSVQREIYMRNSYGLTIWQAKEYTNALNFKKDKILFLQSKQISAERYIAEYESIYDEFKSQVSKIFFSSQFEMWRKVIADNCEIYRMLSEDWLVPIDKVLKVSEIETGYYQKRYDMSLSNMDELGKKKEKARLGTELRSNLNKILGEELGRTYLLRKHIWEDAIKNMDVYNISYKEAYNLSEIERYYKGKRSEVYAKGINKGEQKIELEKVENDKLQALTTMLENSTFLKWESRMNNYLEFSLINDYGLSKLQVEKFKELYNSYVFEDYKIRKSRSSESDKYIMSMKAHQKFCANIKSIFNHKTYDRWLVEMTYKFERHRDSKRNANK